MSFSMTGLQDHPPRPIQFLSFAQVSERTGFSDRYLRKAIKDGMYPPPLKIGSTIRFVQDEIEQVQRAWIREESKDQIRSRVVKMVFAR